MKKIKKMFLNFPITREIFFFLCQKKINKNHLDKKIEKLLEGEVSLSNKKIKNLIVSLTSFPERIDEIKYVIYSIFDQTVQPEKTILWLADTQFPNKENDLPPVLLNFRRFGFEIRWCDNLGSYKKLIPTLLDFQNYFVITADDDIYYKKRWLEKIWQEHLDYPDDIICHIAKRIKFNVNGDILPYKNWRANIRSSKASFLNFPLCGGGALFYNSLLSSDVINKNLFTNLAPYADDIWFYFMIIRKNVRIRVVKSPYNRVKYINPYREYNLVNQYKLSSINLDKDQNDIQIMNIIDYYKMDLYALIDV